MSAPILTAVIAALGTLLAAAATYWFTKQREREAEWRKEKLAYYKAFVESLSGILEGESSAEGQRVFAKACNNLLLFAPQRVISALDEFKSEIRVTNRDRSIERHDKFLSNLLLEIRKDLSIEPHDDPGTFKVALWASGVKNDAT